MREEPTPPSITGFEKRMSLLNETAYDAVMLYIHQRRASEVLLTCTTHIFVLATMSIGEARPDPINNAAG